jgi:anti-sigma regulatory factor (Ser/Thr protein kinase)
MQSVKQSAPHRILIVGNLDSIEPGVREEIADLCEHADVTGDLDTAAKMLAATPYDLVLVEFSGSCADDVRPVRKLRDVSPHAKVIVFVEDSTPEKVICAMRDHAFSYFSKPCDPHVVGEIVRGALRIRSKWSDAIELMSADARYLSLRLQCRRLTADRLVQFMRELPVDLPEDERTDMAQALREMLLNAIEHGGKLNPNEWVRVSRVRTKRSLVYHIQDPGGGFVRENLPHAALNSPDDPFSHAQYREEEGLRPGGFGMLIVTHLVDEVLYNEQGNEVILIKYLD